jgi:hypothetical protein
MGCGHLGCTDHVRRSRVAEEGTAAVRRRHPILLAAGDVDCCNLRLGLRRNNRDLTCLLEIKEIPREGKSQRVVAQLLLLMLRMRAIAGEGVVGGWLVREHSGITRALNETYGADSSAPHVRQVTATSGHAR